MAEFLLIVVACLFVYVWLYLTTKIQVMIDLSRAGRGGSDGWIYAFRGRNDPPWIVKIGRSVDVLSRLRQHRTASQGGITLVAICAVEDVVEAESSIHRRFANVRRDGEWFTLTPRLWWYLRVLNHEMLREHLQESLDKTRR